MISVALKDFYDALVVSKAVSSAKVPYAVVKINGNTMDVCTSDGYRKFVKRMNIENSDNTESSFVVSLEKILGILGNYLPADGISASPLNIEFGGENIVSLYCEHSLSEEKYAEGLAGKRVNVLNNKVAVESSAEQRHAMLCRTDYDSLLNEPDSCDEWVVSTLKENISRLNIDQATKTIYTSSRRSEMFAVGSNQLSIIKIEPINFGFNLEVSTAKAVVDALGKFDCSTAKVYSVENGRYATFLNESCTMALWVAGVANTRGDISKLELYTNPEVAYDNYKGLCIKVSLMTAVNAIIGSDKSDSQEFEIIDIDTEPKIKMSNVIAGGSVSNTFTTEFIDFALGTDINENLKGKIVVKTLKDMLSNCKENFVRLCVQRFNEYAIVRVDDIVIKDNAIDIKSSHFTMINTR